MPVTYTLHNKTTTNTKPIKDYLILAKEVNTENMDRFFVKLVENKVVNPQAITTTELKKRPGNLVQVSKEVYDKYIQVINHQSKVSYSSIDRMIEMPKKSTPKKKTEVKTEVSVPANEVAFRDLTEAEKFYINGKAATDPPQAIANALGVPLEVVQANIASIRPESKMRKMVMTKTSGGRKGIAVMTEAGSEYADGAKPAKRVNQNNHIHKPYGDE